MVNEFAVVVQRLKLTTRILSEIWDLLIQNRWPVGIGACNISRKVFAPFPATFKLRLRYSLSSTVDQAIGSIISDMPLEVAMAASMRLLIIAGAMFLF